MRTIRRLLAVSLTWSISELLEVGDSIQRGRMLARADRDLRF